MPNAGANSPLVNVEGSYLLLIPSRFPPISLFQRIAEGNDDAVAAIESITNPRLAEKRRLMATKPFLDEKTPSLQNWNHAPFAYPNPEGSHFFGPTVPCLELSADIQTALAVSVSKRRTFLQRTGQGRLNLDLRVLSRTVKGRFVDGREWPVGQSTGERWKLGEAVMERGADGLLFRSNERPAGDRIAILNGGVLGTAIQGDHYRYVWDGERFSSLYSFNDGKEIDPDRLANDNAILAA